MFLKHWVKKRCFFTLLIFAKDIAFKKVRHSISALRRRPTPF